MRRYLIHAVVALTAITMAAGCASSRPHIDYKPQKIDDSRWVPRAERFVVIVDDSSSMRREKKIEIATDLTRSMSQTIPAFDYDAGLRSFGQGGCLPREETSLLTGMARYSASAFGSSLDRVTCADGNSPLGSALKAAGEDLGAASGEVAIIAISDGLDMGETELKAASALTEKFGDRLCIHTIQVGDDPRGEKMLAEVAAVTGCGGRVSASDLTDGTAMARFVQDAFLYPDSDGDGVPDHLDKCPDTAHGVGVDASGCPLDSDGDGVSDALDKCPDTPKGVPVDDTGCPPEGIEAVDGEWVIRGRLLFDTNKWDLKPEALPVLDQAVNYLKKNTQWLVEIQGHTDSTGPMKWNQTLSARRAESVKDYMVTKGVASSRLTTKGFGASEPKESNDTREGRAQNRRVDFRPMEK